MTNDLTSITNTGGDVSTFSVDSAHRVTSVTQQNPGGTDATTRFAYAAGQATVAGPDTDQAQAISAVPHTTYTVGAGYLVTRAVDPLGRNQSATYTPMDDVASYTGCW